eukprot:12422570-Karenia_brevis.AAC.1
MEEARTKRRLSLSGRSNSELEEEKIDVIENAIEMRATQKCLLLIHRLSTIWRKERKTKFKSPHGGTTTKRCLIGSAGL